MKACKVLPGCTYNFTGDEKEFLEHLRKALYASKVISYAQGFMLLREAAKVSGGTNNVSNKVLLRHEYIQRQNALVKCHINSHKFN